MWTTNQRHNASRLFLRRLGIVGLFVLVILAVSGVSSTYKKERESLALRSQAERERMELQERQLQLEGDIAKLKTNRGLEEVLRKQYALAQQGEKLIVIVDPSTTTPIHTSTFIEKVRRLFWSW